MRAEIHFKSVMRRMNPGMNGSSQPDGMFAVKIGFLERTIKEVNGNFYQNPLV